jgi:NADH dehydrogenase
MSKPARVIVVGAGFGGFHAARRLEHLLPRARADITVVSPTDHLLYTPLLPEVAGGVLQPRDVAVGLTGALRSPLVPGRAVDVDLERHQLDVRTADGQIRLPWDRLVLAPGSVTRALPVEGFAEHTIGFRTTGEATYLRDHVLGQLEIAAATADPALRREHSTFVVVGAGFAGTELTAFLQLLSRRMVRQARSGKAVDPRWVLVDAAPRVLGELEPALSARAERVLRGRGVDVRLSTTLRAVDERGVVLADGTRILARTVVACAGTRPSPLVHGLGVPLDRGRVLVDAGLRLAGHPDVFVLGDAAAVPDLTRPGAQTAPTAQHAARQGVAAARNVAASLGVGTARPYRHHDLGLAADLGGHQGVARPLGVPVTGPAARLAARGYHLWALPANRARVATSWALTAWRGPQLVRLDLAAAADVQLGAVLAHAGSGGER